MNIVLGFRLLLLTFFLSACAVNYNQQQSAECPQPQQNCRPGAWVGAGFDTSSVPSDIPDFYVKIEAVTSLNSPENEWAVHFGDRNRTFLTAANFGRERLYSVSFSAPARATIDYLVKAEGMASFGSPVLRGNSAILSGVSLDAVTGDAELLSANYTGTAFSDIRNIGSTVNTPLVWDSHPALSPDGHTLFFASERGASYGGTDIWFSRQLSDGTWSAPINCGINVNSRCDELTPFVSADGKTLLFSSSGHYTVGGYDIFKCEIEPAFWTEKNWDKTRADKFFSIAKNLGAPLNTSADELFPTSPAGIDTLLYYSSNQPNPDAPKQKSGGFDIYVLHRLPRLLIPRFSRDSKLDIPFTPKKQEISDLKEKREEPKTSEKLRETEKKTIPVAQEKSADIAPDITISGVVIDKRTSMPVDSAVVSVKESALQRTLDKTTTDSAGRYTVKAPRGKEVEISAQRKDRFPDSKKVKFDDTTTVARISLVLPEDFTLRVNFPNDEFQNPYPNVLDSNGLATNQLWQESLELIADNIMAYKNFVRKIILIGHTDDVASDAYNQQLGQRRADFVRNELLKRGVPRELLETRSKGESELLLRRTDESIDIWRTRCRRVELVKILR